MFSKRFGETLLLILEFCLGVECRALSKSSCALLTILSVVSVRLLRVLFDVRMVLWLLWFDFCWTLVVGAGTVELEFVEDSDAWIELWLFFEDAALLEATVVLTEWTTLRVTDTLLVAILLLVAGDSGSSVMVLEYEETNWEIVEKKNQNFSSTYVTVGLFFVGPCTWPTSLQFSPSHCERKWNGVFDLSLDLFSGSNWSLISKSTSRKRMQIQIGPLSTKKFKNIKTSSTKSWI